MGSAKQNRGTERSITGDQHERYRLRLYITGPTSASARALVNTRRVCELYLKGRYTLEVINLAENVDSAIRDQVVAAPTLIKFSPPPSKRFIGDMSNEERLKRGLGLLSAAK